MGIPAKPMVPWLAAISHLEQSCRKSGIAIETNLTGNQGLPTSLVIPWWVTSNHLQSNAGGIDFQTVKPL